MKIVQFAASSVFGGAEKSFVELSNGLSKCHDVTALLLRDCEYRRRFFDNVETVELTSNPTKRNPFLIYELYRQLRTINPDIIHTHTAKSAELIRQANRFVGFKHVGTKRNDRKGRVFNAMDWVVAVSEKTRGSIRLKQGAVLEVIYNGLVEKELKKAEKSDVFTLLAIGRLDKIKGFDILIQQVRKLDFPYQLHIVGEGPEKKMLMELIAEHQLQDSVFLTGFSDDIGQMMHNSHGVIISSYREGFSNVLVEALFYAPVLLATPVGAVVEVLPKEFQAPQTGLGDKIVDLYQNYNEYTNRFDLLRQEKKNLFRQSNIVRKYEAFYQKILTS